MTLIRVRFDASITQIGTPRTPLFAIIHLKLTTVLWATFCFATIYSDFAKYTPFLPNDLTGIGDKSVQVICDV